MLSRYNRAVLALAVAALALVLSGCVLNWYPDGKVPEPCGAAHRATLAACAVESEACAAAKAAEAQACAPQTTPTKGQEGDGKPAPAPDPLPGPLTCANLDCAPGYTCQETPGGPLCVQVEPPATPPDAGCSIDGEPGPAIAGHAMQFGEQVNAAVRTVTGQDGGRIVVEQGRQAFQAAVIAQLRASGLCAGQHEPGSDEIAVATSASSPREGYHVYAGADAGPGTAVLSPQANRGAWAPPAGTTEPNHPEIPESSCGEPTPPALGKIKLECHQGRPGVTVCDSTPLVYSPGGTFCASVGFFNPDGQTGRLFCSPRQEGDPRRLPCEQDILGAPAPVFVWDGPADQFAIRDNPFTAEFSTGKGTVKACNADRSLCSEVQP
jgi:hypothetical protein